MSKPFKSIDEQVEILKNRKLNIENEEYVKEILSQVNYYNIINGYKSIFLKRDLNGHYREPESYKENSSFEELYQLYSMDLELKNVIFYYILRFEKLLKTSCAYHFSEKFKETYAYLQMKNYSHDLVNLGKVLKNLSTLSKLVDKNNNNKCGKPAIKHYIKNHNEIPLWVLINFLTLGNISYFYNALDNSLQTKISKDFGKRFKKEYSVGEKVDSGELKDIIKIFNLFRNIAAHDEVMFSSKLDKTISTTKFKKFFQADFKGAYLFDVVLLLKLVLPKNEYKELLEKLENIFGKYKDKFKSIEFKDILLLSGFKLNWKDIISIEKMKKTEGKK